MSQNCMGPSPWTRSSFSTLKIATFLKKICKLLQPWSPLHFLTSNFFSKLGCAQQSIFPGTLTFNVGGLSPSSSFGRRSSGGQTWAAWHSDGDLNSKREFLDVWVEKIQEKATRHFDIEQRRVWHWRREEQSKLGARDEALRADLPTYSSVNGGGKMFLARRGYYKDFYSTMAFHFDLTPPTMSK